jgi:heparan-alpha-glucosaminide N-acetyltransferase
LGALILKKYVDSNESKKLIGILLSLGVLMLIAGLISRNYFIISKIWATPTWVFLCCAIAFGSFSFIYWLVDKKGKVHWFDIIKPAGTSTLTCYLIPYFYYCIADLSGIELPHFLKTGALGLVKSLAYSMIVIGITAVLGKMKIKLKI